MLGACIECWAEYYFSTITKQCEQVDDQNKIINCIEYD